MNDYHSKDALNYRPRWIAEAIRESIQNHPVVVLTGARQTGKSTLLEYEPPFRDWHHVNLDNLDVLEQAQKAPASLWAGEERIVIDEVQRAPELLQEVKRAVDKSKKRMRFILSGSANLLLMKSVSESLAGRAIYFALLPMTRGEVKKNKPPRILTDLARSKFPSKEGIRGKAVSPFPLMLKGCMPPLLDVNSTQSIVRWWEGYTITYLERDLRQLSQIHSLPDFRRVMSALALRSGQILNQTEVARDTGVSQPTIYRYTNLLETTCLLERLPAFSINRTKRLIKSPKVIWIDPGLASFLSGYHDTASLRSSREAGSFFENLIYLHLRSWSQLQVPRAKLHYWRTASGHEVDFIAEQGRKLMAIEVKLTASPRFSDIENLRLFLSEYPETAAAILIHTGSQIKRFHEKIIAIPWYLIT